MKKRTSKEFSFRVPIYILMGKRKVKKHYLNLNNYRNNPYHLNNALKVEFGSIISERIPEDVAFTKAEFYYTLYLPDRVGRDVNNVLSVIDKFTQDVLVKKEVVPDDSWKYVTKTVFQFGGFDGNKEGYVDVLVREVH